MNSVCSVTGHHAMNSHPIEQLPAYALGALSEEETRRVAAHLLICPPCREEVEAFRASIGMVPDAPAPPALPHHIKQQLLARIRASKTSRGAALARLPAGGAWSGALVAFALILALVFGVMMVDARRQLATAQGALAALEQERSNASQQMISEFLSNPATVSQPLEGVQQGAHGNMYMQAGRTRAVVLLGGLPPLAPGTTYQFWFAGQQGQVPSGTFLADPDGAAQAVFDAPSAVNSYTEVMVTIEPTGGSVTPSKQIVLAAKLAA